MIVVFNNAAGCYNQIGPNQAEICARKLVGCATNILKTRTHLQNQMTHFIQISNGTSKSRIAWGHEGIGKSTVIKHQQGVQLISGNLGGEGQGGGASPVMWLMILIVMINTFNTFTQGVILRDPLHSRKLVITILSYVDNNSTLKSLELNKTNPEIFEEMGQDMNRWKRILQSTGGNLALKNAQYP